MTIMHITITNVFDWSTEDCQAYAPMLICTKVTGRYVKHTEHNMFWFVVFIQQIL